MGHARTGRRLLLVLTALLAVTVAASGLYLSGSSEPTPEALGINAGYENQKQSADGYAHWQPASPTGVGLIFYQGGKVQEEAYGPLILPLLDHGISLFLPDMPFNLAVFNSDAALDIINAHPEINTWWLAGHSLGGAMAADFVYEHPDLISALILMAAYPQDSKPLNDFSGDVLAFFATRDGLVNSNEISKWQALLPAHAKVIMVTGGNHAQFGSYGPQKNDLTAEISREAQQQFVREALLSVLESEMTLEFEGIIESVEGNRLLIETIDYDLFDLAWVDFMPGTKILDQQGNLLSPEDLKPATKVKVVIVPVIRESYPVQVSATEVVVQ